MSKYKLPEDMCTPPCHRPDDCHDWDHDHDMPDKPKHDHSKTVLKCGTGSGFVIPTRNGRYDGNCGGQGYGDPHMPPMVAAIVSINTEGMKEPVTKVDFSSMINFKAETWNGNFEIKLVFQLSKICNKGPKIPLGTWIYEKEVDVDHHGGRMSSDPSVQGGKDHNGGAQVDIDFKQPFCFTWCECGDCPDCCTYIVELVHWDTDNIECASVTNIGINAIASSC